MLQVSERKPMSDSLRTVAEDLRRQPQQGLMWSFHDVNMD